MIPISSFAADLVGFAGSFCIVAAYAYSNLAKAMNMVAFNLLNLVGAALLTVSLMVNFNLPTLVLEIVWMAIALFGLARALRAPRPSSADAESGA